MCNLSLIFLLEDPSQGKKKSYTTSYDLGSARRQLAGPFTGHSPQHSVADEPNDDHSAASADDDINDSLPATNDLRPGIVTYQRPLRYAVSN